MLYGNKFLDVNLKELCLYDKRFEDLETSNDEFISSDYINFLNNQVIDLNIYKSTKELFNDIEQINKKRRKNIDPVLLRHLDNEYIRVREELVLINLKLVNWVIRNFFFDIDVDKEDLQMVGLYGLVDAINRFKYKGSSTFSAFAVVLIINRIRDNFKEIYGMSWSDFINIKLIENYRDLIIDKDPLNIKCVTADDLSQRYINLSSKKIMNLDNMIKGIDLFDTILDMDKLDEILEMPINEEKYQMADQLEDNLNLETYDIEMKVINKLNDEKEIDIIMSLLNNLNEREKDVIMQHYGINCAKKTLEQIGLDYGLTKSWIQQIDAKALGKLRKFYQQELNKREYNYSINSIEYDDYIYQKLLHLQELHMTNESILKFMNMEDLNWNLEDISIELKKMDNIELYCLRLRLDKYLLFEIQDKIKERYGLMFSKKFIKQLLKKYQIKAASNKDTKVYKIK